MESLSRFVNALLNMLPFTLRRGDLFAAKPDIEPSLAPLAAEALQVALEELGCGETNENNAGNDVVRYRFGRDTRGPWCASFVGWCFVQASINLDMELPFATSAGAKRLFKNVARVGRKVAAPCPGDIICWHRGKEGSWTGHIGFVEGVTDDGIVHTVEGNVGAFPAIVSRFIHDLSYERVYGVVRLS